MSAVKLSRKDYTCCFATIDLFCRVLIQQSHFAIRSTGEHLRVRKGPNNLRWLSNQIIKSCVKIRFRILYSPELKSVNPNAKTNSIVLGVDDKGDEDKPLFVCPVPAESEEQIQESFNGRFSDMRRALFSLSEEDHQLVTRVKSLFNAHTYSVISNYFVTSTISLCL